MNINLIVVGRVREKYINEGINEFKKRLSSYCDLKIIEVADEPAPDNLSKREEELVKNKEGEKILKRIPKNTYIIPLVIEGRQLKSEGLAEKIENLGIDGFSDITFIIGGSIGISDEIIKMANFKLSFSKMTFPHQLMRLILLEQIYRSFRIIRNEPYHK